MTAGRTASATIFAFFLDDRLGLRSGGRLSSSASFFLGLNTRLLDRGLFGLAVVFGAALFVFALLGALAIIATASFLERRQARFLGLAQKAGLHFLARSDVIDRRGALRLRSRGSGLRRRLRRFGDGFRLRSLGGRSFARASKNSALLDLDHHGVGAAVAEALLDLAGLDRALEAQRRPGSKLRLVGLVCHPIPSSNLHQPSRGQKRGRRPLDPHGDQ